MVWHRWGSGCPFNSHRQATESRWKVAGVALVVVAILAAGAAAQHQLSHTSLAVSLPLGDLAVAASLGQQNTLSEVPHEVHSVDGFLEQQHRGASPGNGPNKLLRITPVKLTQAGTPEVLDEAPGNPGTLTSEADEPFFIVVNDVTVDTTNNPLPTSYELLHAGTNIPEDSAETSPSATAEVQDAATIPREEDPLSTQYSLNADKETDQSIWSPDDDAERIDPSVLSGERGAKTITAVAPAVTEVLQQPLAKNSALQAEQSLDITSVEVFTESFHASTLPVEAQFQELSQGTDEALPTETPIRISLTDVSTEDELSNDPLATDSPGSPEIFFEEQTPDVVPVSTSADEQTPAPVPSETHGQVPSPAPIPVRISLDDPESNTVLDKQSENDAKHGQIPHEVSGVTAHAGTRELHNLKGPQTQLEMGIAEVEFSGFENTAESPIDQLPGPENEEELAPQKNRAGAPAATAVADAADNTSETQLKAGLVNNEVLLVQDLPEGTGGAPEDTGDPFAPQIENFKPDPPIDADELAIVPEWIAEDSASGEIFNQSDVIEVPNLPMDDIKLFFLAEDPQADALATEVQGTGVTEVKQQLQKDEVHIAALSDTVPFSPGEGQVTLELQEAVKDALKAEITAMGSFGLRLPDGATATTIPPAPTPTTLSAPAPAPGNIFGAAPTPGPPQAAEIDTTIDPSSEPISKLAPIPLEAPVQKLPLETTEPSTPENIHSLVQEPTLNESPQQNLQPEPAKIQKPAAPLTAPVKDSVPTPAPVPQATEAPAQISPEPIINQQPPSISQTYHATPKPIDSADQPQPEPNHPPYKPQPSPTRRPYRPTKDPVPTTYSPPIASPPMKYEPGRPPISFVKFGEPKPEHFKPPSYQGPIFHLPSSYDDLPSPPRHPPRPPPIPAPPPPSYKPPPSTSSKPPSSPSYTQHRPPSSKPRPSMKYPPALSSPPQYRPPPRLKPFSHATQYEKPTVTTPKPHYRPPSAMHNPHKPQKPILAPLLVPAHPSSILFPKGVTFSGHRKPRPPFLFRLPSFFRTKRKQRLQVPESVVSRLDSDQPDWVADMEPERR